VHRAGKDVFVLSIELGSPGTAPGWAVPPNSLGYHPYFTVFAVCAECAETDDLSKGWELLDPSRFEYKRDRQGMQHSEVCSLAVHYCRATHDRICRLSANPTIRFFDGWFYLIVSFEGVEHPDGPHCNSNSSKWVRGCIVQHISRSTNLQDWYQ
jgi:hypothetical protein